MRIRGCNSTLQTYNTAYKYSFNGKGQDKSITSQDYDYAMRIYDARTAKFLREVGRIYPISKKFVSSGIIVKSGIQQITNRDGSIATTSNNIWELKDYNANATKLEIEK